MRYYILDAEHHVVEARTVLEWARWFENLANRLVDQTELRGGARVSTVFLGFNHRFSSCKRGPPLLFETMVFGGKLDGQQWRYSSWDDAETGHQAAVRRARAAQRGRDVAAKRDWKA